MKMLENIGATVKGLVKLLLLSRPTKIKPAKDGPTVVVMANGPSLKDSLVKDSKYFEEYPTIAVNFAPISDEFFSVKPEYLVLADPHFFKEPGDDSNLNRLKDAMARIDWPLTIFVPVKEVSTARQRWQNQNITVVGFNNVGIEGFNWFRDMVYSHRLGMPRPRNVAIPSLMLAMWLGYKEILVFGADHSWMKTISVTDENEVVSVQPHFYKEDGREEERVRHEYRGYRLHQIVESFAVAFRSYMDIARFAKTIGCSIINLTPGSMIDAFPRKRPEK